MYIDMELLQEKILISMSLSIFKEDYYSLGIGRGFRYGNGNTFYRYKQVLSNYSPNYDVNCLYNV